MATNGVLPLAISLVIFSVIFTIAYRQIDDRYKVGPYIQFLRSLDGVKLWVFWLPPAMSIGLFIAMALGVFETKNQDLDEQRISSNASPTGYGPPPAKSPPPTTTASPTPTAESAQALRDRLAAEEAATHNATQICPGCAMRVYKVGGCNHVSCQYCCGSLPRRSGFHVSRSRMRREIDRVEN